MDIDIYTPFGTNYYVDDDVQLIYFLNKTNKFLWFYNNKLTLIILMPPFSERKYMFLKKVKKINLIIKSVSYTLYLVNNRLFKFYNVDDYLKISYQQLFLN